MTLQAWKPAFSAARAIVTMADSPFSNPDMSVVGMDTENFIVVSSCWGSCRRVGAGQVVRDPDRASGPSRSQTAADEQGLSDDMNRKA